MTIMHDVVICKCGVLTPAARFCRKCGQFLHRAQFVVVKSEQALEALNDGKSVRAEPGLYEACAGEFWTIPN